MDLLAFGVHAWRRRIAAIFQDFMRYELTVAENVGFGAVRRLGDRAALERAAARAGATGIIAGLPAGWETVLSRRYADGADLSGGQWQRRIAAIFQDFVQYHLSVRENVGLGAPAHAADLDRLRAAAAKAGALELIESLPRGWDTVLSRRYTDGVDLSGGQ